MCQEYVLEIDVIKIKYEKAYLIFKHSWKKTVICRNCL